MKTIYNIIEKDTIFFDLETTGLSIKEDRIVELCAVKYRKDKTKVSIHKYFNPNREVSKEAEEIHGLTNEFLSTYDSFDSSSTELFEFFSGCDLGGYNCMTFDIPMLFEEFARCNKQLNVFNINIIDSYQLLNKYETRKLNDIYKRFFNKDIENAHNTEADIEATIKIFEKQVELYKLEDKNINEISDIIKTTSDGSKLIDLSGWFKKTPSNEYLYNKGKHKDTLIKDNLSYLKWFMECKDMETNSRSVANKLYNYLSKEKVK